MKVIKAEDTRLLEPFRDRIIEGDCLEVMKSIPGESIDMILCDLPYGTTQNKWDSIIDLDLLFAQYMRIIKPHGAIVLTKLPAPTYSQKKPRNSVSHRHLNP